MTTLVTYPLGYTITTEQKMKIFQCLHILRPTEIVNILPSCSQIDVHQLVRELSGFETTVIGPPRGVTPNTFLDRVECDTYIGIDLNARRLEAAISPNYTDAVIIVANRYQEFSKSKEKDEVLFHTKKHNIPVIGIPA